jgi:hypothetical protein
MIGLLLPFVFVPLVAMGGWSKWWEVSVALVAFYITAGALIVRGMEWWQRRGLAIKVKIVERQPQ